MKYNKISFIIPCYNCAGTIEESIFSILSQPISIPFEIVCTDDKSTDLTKSVLQKYESLGKINLFYHENNKGGSAASNTCVKHSTGDLLFRLDSDNVLENDSIQPLLDLIEISGCEASSFSNIYYFTNRENKIPVAKWEYKHDQNWICSIKDAIKSTRVPPSSGNYLYTREIYDKVGGYKEDAGAVDSWGLGFEQLAIGGKIAILPNSYYWHELNMGGYYMREEKNNNNSKNAVKIIRKHADIFDENSKNIINNFSDKQNIFNVIDSGILKLSRGENVI